MVGDAGVRHGRLILRHTRIGARSFIGNSAVVPDGDVIPDECLLGVLSTPPSTEQMTPGSAWFGTPSIFLPKRQTFGPHDQSLTFQPPLRRILARGAIELVRIVIPVSIIIALAVLLITTLGAVQTRLRPDRGGFAPARALSP